MTNDTAAVQPKSTNLFAILSIIFVWFGALFGLIFGYIALSQIKRTGEGGRGIALAAVIIGWVAVASAVIAFIAIFAIAFSQS
ncbi:ABC-type antimicrobial peptide transport system permease subunit [Microbacterium halimionae]|uniref:ABC-type antimicrobial peptide transport system permease subunit n=1 Tax=Microbacterium halimionae TaxID=1526413 RepID=A0A7W3JM24_9MICO|nr:DUF4190 domain-containing protein [Microbacterium halimionae]MBA8815209.1 ABC-type antimicrobial peptide transport system permease subunit [Microbacterium halimionae]NII94000.1 ABC-type antimicrobial peptide transport system permease subunit [Microbacterium halimionae]